ncbi:MAG: hypothetical protein COW26_01980 [Nitrosopumilales archaeon CG15_BIG_FIL_POST_REV_8_21_14_020_33_23]|nr:MAG: hypothetical protein COW26_01980 [Nitrosopumilales archaeon CG15_BIG_FIL_POST_REV_8_21_14_020_33_23]PJB96655.1 MAG: hypothetical protein CO079_09380 [Nitrosopumilales archaeon CG_4_9_14_0_8_um_filter_34_10]
MNIYDTQVIRCIKCDKCIGEIDYEAKVIRPMCGQCYDPKPDVKDQLSYRVKITATKKTENPIPI